MTKKLVIIALLTITAIASASDLSSSSSSLSSSSGSGADNGDNALPVAHTLVDDPTASPARALSAVPSLAPALAALAEQAASGAQAAPVAPLPLALSASGEKDAAALTPQAPHASLSGSALQLPAATTTTATVDLSQFAELLGLTEDQIREYTVTTVQGTDELSIHAGRAVKAQNAKLLADYIFGLDALGQLKEVALQKLYKDFCAQHLQITDKTASVIIGLPDGDLKLAARGRVIDLARPAQDILDRHTRVVAAFFDKSTGSVFTVTGLFALLGGFSLMRSSFNASIVRSAAAFLQFAAKNGIGLSLAGAGTAGILKGLSMRQRANAQLAKDNPQGLIKGYFAAQRAKSDIQATNRTILDQAKALQMNKS